MAASARVRRGGVRVVRLIVRRETLAKAGTAREQLALELKSEQQSSAQAAHQAAEVKTRLDGLTAELERVNANVLGVVLVDVKGDDKLYRY